MSQIFFLKGQKKPQKRIYIYIYKKKKNDVLQASQNIKRSHFCQISFNFFFQREEKETRLQYCSIVLSASTYDWSAAFAQGQLPLPMVSCLCPWSAAFAHGQLPLPMVSCLCPWSAAFAHDQLPLPMVSCLCPWSAAFAHGILRQL